ncbi:MAG TPA: zf-HC2 domain-containing protein [Candidatus Polarisedimenticolia bacterium]|nr:zf-HC2 domain-containing protein [Candidatus Polarisedimenticolia bacterium]
MSHEHRSSEPTCREVFDLLSEFVDGELTDSLRESLSRHLSACPPCEEFLKTFQVTRSLCRESLMETMPDELKVRLRSFLRIQIQKK